LQQQMKEVMENDDEESSKKEVTEESNDSEGKIVTCEISLDEEVLKWRIVRTHTIKSLRQLADHLDNVGGLVNMIVAVRGNFFERGLLVGSGILTFAVGLSVPFLVAGAGIGLASFISRVVGIGGSYIGSCLGVVGGVLTVATAGAALPVVVAGCGIWFASGVARWIGAGGSLLARGVSLLGGGVMLFTASAAALVCIAGTGLLLAVPAITRETLGSKFVENATKAIIEDIILSSALIDSLEKEIEDKHDTAKLACIKDAVYSDMVVLHEGAPVTWSLKDLRDGVRGLAKDWKEGATHIRVIADQLEEAANMV